MKRSFLLFSLLLTLPFQSWAIFGVADTSITIGDISFPVHMGNFGQLTAINAQLVGLNAQQAYNNVMTSYNMYQQNGSIGSAFAAVPGSAYTLTASLEKNRNKTEELVEEVGMLREAFVQDAEIIDLSPREIFQKIKQGMSGDWVGFLREEAQKKFNQIKEKLVEQFTEEKLAEMAAGFVEDILSCKTPQIDAIYPSVDLDMSLLMCDYKQMFSDMKEQVNAIGKRDWGDSFTLNGRPIDDILKDGDLLRETVEMVPPSMGRKLTLDFLSDMSVKTSVQTSVDATAIGKEISQIVGPGRRAFSSRNLMDAIDDLINVQVKTTQLQSVQANAANKLQSLNNEITKLEAEKELREEMLDEAKRVRSSVDPILTTQ